MKTLYLLRHAKSSWENPDLDDFDRPLLQKGLKKSKVIIDYLLKNSVHVDLIISSPAVRALETAAFFADALKYPNVLIRKEKSLYFGDPDSYFSQFYDIPKHVNSLMLVGHNPAITYFANLLLKQKIEFLPTSGIVSIIFEAENWEEAADARRKTNFVVYPGMFMKD